MPFITHSPCGIIPLLLGHRYLSLTAGTNPYSTQVNPVTCAWPVAGKWHHNGLKKGTLRAIWRLSHSHSFNSICPWHGFNSDEESVKKGEEWYGGLGGDKLHLFTQILRQDWECSWPLWLGRDIFNPVTIWLDAEKPCLALNLHLFFFAAISSHLHHLWCNQVVILSQNPAL